MWTRRDAARRLKDRPQRDTRMQEVAVLWFAALACGGEEPPAVQKDEDDGVGEPTSPTADTGDVRPTHTGTVEDTGPEGQWWDPESPLEGTWSGACVLSEGEDTLPDLWFELSLHGQLEVVRGAGRFGYTESVSYGGSTGGGGTATTSEVPYDLPIVVEGSLVDSVLVLEPRTRGQRLPFDVTGATPTNDVLPLAVTDAYGGSRYRCDLALVP